MLKTTMGVLLICLLMVLVAGCTTTKHGWVSFNEADPIDGFKDQRFDVVKDHGSKFIAIKGEILPDTLGRLQQAEFIETVASTTGGDSSIRPKCSVDDCLEKMFQEVMITSYIPGITDERFLMHFQRKVMHQGNTPVGCGYLITSNGNSYCYFAWRDDSDKFHLAVNGVMPHPEMRAFMGSNEWAMDSTVVKGCVVTLLDYQDDNPEIIGRLSNLTNPD